MNHDFRRTLSSGAWLGVVCGLGFFSSEWLLTKFHAEISFRTYSFFFLLFVVGGGLGGSVFAAFLRSTSSRFRTTAERPSFLPASFLSVGFFVYGFYYINEQLTPGVGMFSAMSLAATALHLLFSSLMFWLVLRGFQGSQKSILTFLGLSFLPLAALVAVNFRFFLWHSPDTDVRELFIATVSFGAAGLLATGLATAILSAGKKSSLGRPVVNLCLGLLLLLVFAVSGRPSGASFQINAAKSSERVKPKHKNVIWIVMDTARRDQISIYGDVGELTPKIDAFAQDALVMERAISSAPWTIPSHASMFTGMFPSKHAAHRGVPGGKFTNPLSNDHVTITEILQSHGYDTAAFAGNVAGLSRSFGFSQGFNYYFDGRPISFNLFWGKLLMAVPKRQRADLLRVNEICLSSELNGLVFDWLETQSEKQPFFLFINYMEPHDGFEHIPEPYHSMFGYDESEVDRVLEGFDQAKVVRFEQDVTPEQLAIFEKTVARRVFFMDHNIGRLLDTLKERGLYDDSYIVITSDHGELNGEHNSFGHNTDLYNELIWVPLIVKYPGSAKNGFSKQTVQNIDIMPELLTNMEMKLPDGVQGQPFGQVTHEIVAELFEQKKAQALLYPERYYRDLRAIFTNIESDSLKYIWSSNGDDEIYDLRNDPKELNNLASEKPEVVTKLDKHLDEWLRSFAPINFANGETNYSKEVEERLRSLGYIK